MTIKNIHFNSVGKSISGSLFLPKDFDPNNSYKTVVMTPPSHQIKEQTLSIYGPKLAAIGYIALAFDYNSKGESEGYDQSFRNDENAFRKHEDLRNAISYLYSLPYVDQSNLYGLGICAGGNMMSSVAITDLRIKAFASVSAMMATDAMFYSDEVVYQSTIKAANEARQRMFDSGSPENMDIFGFDDPDYLKKNPEATGAQAEGWEYYGTIRGGCAKYANFSNQVLSNINESVAINIGEQYADRLVQPYIGIVGEKAETAFSTVAFFEKVTSQKQYVVIPNASHVDLYDKNEFVDQAVDHITGFFDKV